jgi:hypothetical protein
VSRREEVEEGDQMMAMAFWQGHSPYSILILVLYVLFQYGFPAEAEEMDVKEGVR